jgi:hypothetical protein
VPLPQGLIVPPAIAEDDVTARSNSEHRNVYIASEIRSGQDLGADDHRRRLPPAREARGGTFWGNRSAPARRMQTLEQF